jgi:hypothetical protein
MKDRVYTEKMGQPPMDIDGASAGMSKPRAMAKPAPKMSAPKMPARDESARHYKGVSNATKQK